MKSAKRGKDGKAAARPKRPARRIVSRHRAGRRPGPRAPSSSSRAAKAALGLRIPALLLEKEPPARLPASDPAPAAAPLSTAVSPQPQLKLTPRDPHWLHAHWEFSPDALEEVRQRSAVGPMALRLFEQTPTGRLVSETQVRPEAARWFVHVETPGTAYAAQLGYYDTARKWVPLVSSPPVRTPTNGPSTQGHFELATLSADGTLARHGTSHTLVPPWSAEREAALHALARGTSQPVGDEARTPSSPSSPLAEQAPSQAPSSAGISSLIAAPSSPSSPLGALQGAGAPGFRLEVNAELIVYGATEPDAVLTIGGRPVALAPDGSFRFRFALPDGSYELPVRAEAAARHEARGATLRFSRDTQAQGAVGESPQEPGLKPPVPENC